MTCEVKIIADSISPFGKRLTTFQLKYWRAIHSEMMTHRVFSRNASSSRAIPVAKMIEQVRTNPAMPIHWGKNQPGMQAKEECHEKVGLFVPSYWHDMLEGKWEFNADEAWMVAARHAADVAEAMAEAGYHKQIVNRILEPFQHIHVVVTATEFDNFFELRDHPDAQPEIQVLAGQMRIAMDCSTPTLLQPGEWHLPYVTLEDRTTLNSEFHSEDGRIDELLRRVSAARCCRVSYLKHDGTNSTIKEDLALCDKLVGARPLHASPFEHQATPDVPNATFMFDGHEWVNAELHGNFVGWVQHRKLIEQQHWNAQ